VFEFYHIVGVFFSQGVISLSVTLKNHKNSVVNTNEIWRESTGNEDVSKPSMEEETGKLHIALNYKCYSINLLP